MRTATRILIMIGTFTAAVLLSSCELRFDQSTVVEEDGSGEVAVTLALDEQFRALLQSQTGEDLDFTDPESWDETGNITGDLPEDAEYDIQPYLDGDFEGFVVSLAFDSPEQLAEWAADAQEEGGVLPDVTLKDGTYRIEYQFDLADLDLDANSEDFPVDLGSIFDVSFSVRLPGEITETNGQLGEDGVVRWNPDLGGAGGGEPLAVLYAESQIPGIDPRLIAGGVVAALAVVGFGVWVLRRRSRSPIDRIVESEADAPPTAGPASASAD